MVNLLPFYICTLEVKDEIGTRGSRPPAAPYSFTGLKEYAEKGLRCCGGCKGCLVLWLFPCRSDGKVRPFDTGPDPHHSRFLKSRKSGKGDALRKEKALLHTFVAGQNYGVWRDATRRF